jgi:putative restriction endonuclease
LLIANCSIMHFYVAITDDSWFAYLAAKQPDEINFWRPSGNQSFQRLSPGEPLLFKLHSPRNFIVGGGFFSYYNTLPLSLAWDALGDKNGAPTFDRMRDLIVRRRRAQQDETGEDFQIGCILLQQPFFWKEEDWIPASDWKGPIVQGKTYDTDTFEGQSIWQDVQARLAKPAPDLDESVEIAARKFGKPQVVLPRLGQGAFRVIVADSYRRSCAVTSSHILHILDSAHIRPYAEDGTHSPTNGLLLRQDVHTLFDRGYITVTPEYKIEVSRRIREEFNNGAEYYALHGKAIHLPEVEQFRPAQEALLWHNDNRFKP